METHRNDKTSDRVDRLALPPFVINSWAALAFVEGKYNPPSAKIIEVVPDDFLGIYISKEDPGFGLFTFTGLGEYRAFHRCGTPDTTAEFAMIDAFINYEIPFEQWRTYPIGVTEMESLNKMGVGQAHDNAMKSIASALHQARLSVRPGRPKSPPIFLVSSRSSEAIQGDEKTEMDVWRSLVGEERANRHFQNIAKLRQRASQRDASKGDSGAQ